MQINFKKYYAIAIILFILCFITYSESTAEPNEPSREKAAQLEARPQDIQYDSTVVRTEEAELKAEIYKEMIVHLRWTLGIIIVVAIAGVGYIGISKKKEYKDILAEAREAGKEVRNWEKEARQKFDSIDSLVKDKLTLISEEAEKVRAEIIRYEINRLLQSGGFYRAEFLISHLSRFFPKQSVVNQLNKMEKEEIITWGGGSMEPNSEMRLVKRKHSAE